MDWYPKWLQMHNDSLLPTVFKKDVPSRVPFSGAFGWMFSNHARKLQKDSRSGDESLDKNIYVEDSGFKKKTRNHEVIPAAFPAYLNSSTSYQPSAAQCRRSSLLDGFEQTKRLMENEVRHRIVLPKGHISSEHSSASWDSSEISHLPVPPVLPLYRFEIPDSLRRFSHKPTKHLDSKLSTRTSVIAIVIIFCCAIAALVSVYVNFPELEEHEKQKVKLPRDMEDAKELGRVLSKYKDTYYVEVMSAFFMTYIFLQTFAIPGSVFLSILSGFLYPFYIALFLVCLCSGIGATGCYMISYFIGKPLVNKYLAERVRKWNTVVDGQREHLFNYLLFLRITPFLPNWFINVVSPVIHIPVWLFFSATFIGVAPLSFIAIQAGTTLYQLTTAGDAISWTGIIVMAVLAVLSLVPVLLKKRQ